MNSTQLYDNWHSEREQKEAGQNAGLPVVSTFYNLQAERQLSAAALADPTGYGEKLARQRRLTDTSVQGLQALSGSTPADLVESLQQVERELRQLSGYRNSVDQRTITQEQLSDDYTRIIASDLQFFNGFTNAGPDLVNAGRPVIAALWGKEMLAREDTIFTAGVVSGRLSSTQRSQIAELIGTQQYIYDNEVIPLLPDTQAKVYQDLMTGTAWQQKTTVERAVLSTPVSGSDGRTVVSAQLGKDWQQSIGEVTPQLEQIGNAYSGTLIDLTNDRLDSLMMTMVTTSAVGATVVLLVLLFSVLLTGILRRRIFALRSAALELQTRLPDVVERLRRGETIDPDTELPEIGYGDDELGKLGQALNLARNTALETALRQAEQYRGFERLLQRIARRTQLLIGMQMKRLSEMERRHEDPEVLEGLFDLDHLAARLRRYEENLVILGGGQPQRRWRKPVLLLDVLRSAQGEVQDYRRIRIETEGRAWLTERAVSPMVHVLAELMENAVSFSKPPTPVEVSAAHVGRGLAVEIEDRGMGMEPEQYAEANELMADPPRMDVMSRADDARLGLYVVARLAANLGVKVEFRPSSFGGTRVVVLLPEELLSDGQQPVPQSPSRFPVPNQLAVVGAPRSGQADDSPGPQPRPHDRDVFTRPLIGPWNKQPAQAPDASPAPASRLDPLPRRVRQASLTTELRNPPPAPPAPPAYDDEAHTGAPEPQPLPRRSEPRRSGATVGAFQRQSRMTRLTPDSDHQPAHPPLRP